MSIHTFEPFPSFIVQLPGASVLGEDLLLQLQLDVDDPDGRYRLLVKVQRYTIEALLQTPMSLREIGDVIGVSAGTVSREIRRNCDMRGYHRYRWQLAKRSTKGG